MSTLVRPLTSSAPSTALPLYASLVRVVKSWAHALPLSASTAPSDLLLELMCLQVCGGAGARALPIETPVRPAHSSTTAATTASSHGSGSGSYHVPHGCMDLNVAFRLFLQLCVALDRQRVFWSAFYARSDIPSYYVERRDEKYRLQAALARNTYEAASAIVVSTTPTAAAAAAASASASASAAASAGGSGGAAGGAAAADSKSEPSAADTAAALGNVVYLHPVIPTLNVAEALVDCAPLVWCLHHPVSLLSLLIHS